MPSQQELMIQEGQTYKVVITDLNQEGEGVGRVGNVVVFVSDAIPGDVVLARVISLKKSYAQAIIIEIVDPSPARVTPACPAAKQCGGCQLAHMAYTEQLAWKQKHVQAAMTRIAKLDVPVEPVIGMNQPAAYRNKAEFPVGGTSQQTVLGFYQKRSHVVVDIEECAIQHPLINRAMNAVKEVVAELQIPPYDYNNHSGVIRHAVIRVSFSTKTVMIILVTRTAKLPYASELVSRLTSQLPELRSVYHNINPQMTNMVFGSELKLLWGEPHLIDHIGNLQFAISPRSFFQVNPMQTKVLYDVIKHAAALTGTEVVWDLYCGIGTIGLYLAVSAAKVVGVEIVPEAVEDAKINAKLNGFDHVQFFTGNVEDMAPRLLRLGLRPDLIVVDPPRKGCDPQLLATIAQVRVPRLIYVSCNPATLARDLAFLTENGYVVELVQPVDMFPHTVHVECVTLMSRVKK